MVIEVGSNLKDLLVLVFLILAAAYVMGKAIGTVNR
jgi:hypothetical protein